MRRLTMTPRETHRTPRRLLHAEQRSDDAEHVPHRGRKAWALKPRITTVPLRLPLSVSVPLPAALSLPVMRRPVNCETLRRPRAPRRAIATPPRRPARPIRRLVASPAL